ncbi:MAG: zinc ABC transporter substrate-binding protein, partial [Gammaproteobacteria bacterium]|nr:zinc ABC transporter substrate-binding protein [Gammaproteobacteria bacterium]
NAITIARKMTETLSEFEPQHQSLYQNNLHQLTKKLLLQKNKISKQFIKSDFKYLVYHDALQYFEKQINIAPLAAISTDEEQTPGIRHLSKINKMISDNTINCLIYNTPTLPVIARNLIENKKILPIDIDPLGYDLKAGPDLYFNLLNSIADGYHQCQKYSESH